MLRAKGIREYNEPTTYYFVLLAAKQKRETMDSLMNDEYILLTEDDDIIHELHTFSSNLFTECPRSPEFELATKELLKHTVNHIDRNTKEKLDELPLLEEITNTVKNSQNNVSPRLDGLTNEVFWKCWEFIKHDFYL